MSGTIKITVVQLTDKVLKLNYEVKVLKRDLQNKQDVADFKHFMQQYVDFTHKKFQK